MSRPQLKIKWEAWWRLPQELRFLLAGGYNTAFGFLLFATMYYAFGARIGYLGVAALSYAVSLTSAFVVYRRLVFGTATAWKSSFLRFNLSQSATSFCGALGLFLLVHFVHINPVLAQAMVILVSVVVTYALHRHFSFHVRPSRA